MDTTTIFVCDDCYMPIVNDDFTGLDFAHDSLEAEELAQDIRNGIAQLTNDIGQLSSGNYHEEFATEPCPCCGTRLAGARHEIIGIVEYAASEA